MNELWLWIAIIVEALIIWWLFSRQSDLKFANRSQVVKRGQMLEQFAPLLKDFTSPLENFVFIGKKFDYLVINEDEVLFLEIKSGDAQLNDSEKRLKNLIDNKKVRYVVRRI